MKYPYTVIVRDLESLTERIGAYERAITGIIDVISVSYGMVPSGQYEKVSFGRLSEST